VARKSRRFISSVALSSLLVLSFNAYSSANLQTIKVGAICTTPKKIIKQGGILFTCKTINSHLARWVKGTNSVLVLPTPTPTPTPTPATSLSNTFYQAIKIYPNKVEPKPVPSSDPLGSIVVPSGISTPPSGANVRLWISDPRMPSRALQSTGAFIGNTSAGTVSSFIPANADGSFYTTLAQGKYWIDIVEPGPYPNPALNRHRYILEVSSSGAVSISGLIPDSNGVYVVTVDVITPLSSAGLAFQNKITQLANKPITDFQPTSACQLIDQTSITRNLNTTLTDGFPQIAFRQKTSGAVNALIVPIDFPDVQGVSDPVKLFTSTANGTQNFWSAMSYGQLSINFTIIPQWIKMPFLSTKYGMGSNANGNTDGQPGQYTADVIKYLDGSIDFANYDEVYFLAPDTIPTTSIAYGPAFVTPFYTVDGGIANGAVGGADMYQTLRNGVVGGDWKWMAHETGHTLGFFDEDFKHQQTTLGNWSIMAMNWSNTGLEVGAWDRYIKGWLLDSQVSCFSLDELSSTPKEISINPIESQDRNLKSVMVPLSKTKILVVESRKNLGLDVLSPETEGVLVYTVDMTKPTLGGGYQTIARTGSKLPTMEDAALHAGDFVTVDGVVIRVTSENPKSDQISISR